jgi:Kef-type K+ transport system membrane component KefB/nucleotide-binding universal stress UspA family protein
VLSLFLAIAMSISAVKVIAKTLLDLKLMRRNIGATILAASITDDTIGWILLSVVSSIALTGSVSVGSVMKPLGATAGVIAFAVFLGRPLVRALLGWAERARRVEYAMVSAIVVVTFAFAALTEKLGIHAVFGAFVAGVLVTDSPRLQRATLDALDSVILGVFAPIFFVYTGLRVTTLQLPSAGVTAAILAIALIGKVVGSGLGAKLGGLGFGASLAVGIGMSSRGSMELVVARIGLDLGVLTPSLYAAIVLIPIVTSFTTPALLRLVVSALPPQKSEAERLEREEETKEALITREGAKILVAVSGGERSTQALRFAAAFSQAPGATLVAVSVVPQAPMPMGRQRRSVLTAEATQSTLSAFEAEHAVPDFKPRIVSSPSPVAAIEEELQQGYDLVFVGAGRRRTVSNRILSAVLGDGSANAVLLYAYGQSFPREFKRVLVATDGGFAARGAAELAVLYAESTGAELHATSVVENGSEQLRTVRRRVLQDVGVLASRHDVAVQQRLQEGTPAPRILAAAQEASADLIVLGAVPQALGRQVYLGNTVETVLRHTSCAVALFIPRLSRAHA